MAAFFPLRCCCCKSAATVAYCCFINNGTLAEIPCKIDFWTVCKNLIWSLKMSLKNLFVIYFVTKNYCPTINNFTVFLPIKQQFFEYLFSLLAATCHCELIDRYLNPYVGSVSFVAYSNNKWIYHSHHSAGEWC